VTDLEGSRYVGRYRILDFLGSGAMGEVYLAEDPQIERRLAIKTVRLVGRPQEIEERKRRLLREARAAGRLLHPNVVTLFDAGEAEGMLYLAFELVEGTDLAGRLEKDPPLSLREVLRIIRQTADALDFAHRQGIVHRDIKPSNILIDAHGKVKVADFGIAKVTGQSTELTVAGSVMGSPQYLSPEQIRGEELDGRSDIFSLGVVLYELLSKKRPFDGDTITTLVYQILHKEPPPISELRSVPPRLEALLRRMLAKSRDDRFATAAELATEVMACERELSDETLSAPASSLPMQETRVMPRRTTDVVTPRTDVVAAPPPSPSRPPTPTPPPPPPRAVAGAPPIQPAARPAGTSNAARLAVAVVLVLVLLGTAVGGGLWWYFFYRPKSAETQVGSPPVELGQTTAQSTAEMTQPTPAPPVSSPGLTATPSPGERRPALESTPAPPRLQEPTPGGVRTTPPAETHPAAPPLPPVTTPPVQESPRVPVETRPQANDTKGEEDDEAPAPRRGGDFGTPDAVVNSGLSLVFQPTPADAFVLVDGTPIGRASEWSGRKGGRTYTLSGPGEYQIKIRSEGLKEYRLLVRASATAGVTPILARLRPLAAAQADASDLRTYRVSEAVAFKVDPPNATILVDGQTAGPASSFGGRFAQPKTWLRLPVGRHRIGVTAPGRARQDFLVEVSEGAEKDKDRIEVELQSGGSE
jgi:serine/threonine-protein kinase